MLSDFLSYFRDRSFSFQFSSPPIPGEYFQFVSDNYPWSPPSGHFCCPVCRGIRLPPPKPSCPKCHGVQFSTLQPRIYGLNFFGRVPIERLMFVHNLQHRRRVHFGAAPESALIDANFRPLFLSSQNAFHTVNIFGDVKTACLSAPIPKKACLPRKEHVSNSGVTVPASEILDRHADDYSSTPELEDIAGNGYFNMSPDSQHFFRDRYEDSPDSVHSVLSLRSPFRFILPSDSSSDFSCGQLSPSPLREWAGDGAYRIRCFSPNTSSSSDSSSDSSSTSNTSQSPPVEISRSRSISPENPNLLSKSPSVTHSRSNSPSPPEFLPLENERLENYEQILLRQKSELQDSDLSPKKVNFFAKFSLCF